MHQFWQSLKDDFKDYFFSYGSLFQTASTVGTLSHVVCSDAVRSMPQNDTDSFRNMSRNWRRSIFSLHAVYLRCLRMFGLLMDPVLHVRRDMLLYFCEVNVFSDFSPSFIQLTNFYFIFSARLLASVISDSLNARMRWVGEEAERLTIIVCSPWNIYKVALIVRCPVRCTYSVRFLAMFRERYSHTL